MKFALIYKLTDTFKRNYLNAIFIYGRSIRLRIYRVRESAT